MRTLSVPRSRRRSSSRSASSSDGQGSSRRAAFKAACRGVSPVNTLDSLPSDSRIAKFRLPSWRTIEYLLRLFIVKASIKTHCRNQEKASGLILRAAKDDYSLSRNSTARYDLCLIFIVPPSPPVQALLPVLFDVSCVRVP